MNSNYTSFILILATCIIFAIAEDTNIVVNEKNQQKYGLPVGTVLEKDPGTRLAKPPPLSDNFTADDRLQLMWNNEKTRKNYCKTGPGKLKQMQIKYNFYYKNWCRDTDGEDICCEGTTCQCLLNFPVVGGCKCSPEK